MFFINEVAQHFAEKLWVLFVEHSQGKKTVIRRAVLLLAVAGEERDVTAHGAEQLTPPSSRYPADEPWGRFGDAAAKDTGGA
ncbi:hypothetical protein [Sorangium sp. So ce204]|uniref:hypothetical protein n=1 Tax=Sorangium sp. So ce204 TaxID=3133288 RepID=UPI003F60C295